MNQAKQFRVALSDSFQTDIGEPVFPMFDLSPLVNDPDIEFDYVSGVEGRMTAQSLEDFDALILLLETFDADSIPLSGRLSVGARFGVGYDTVDVEACTAAGIAVGITPDGVRRPVATSILFSTRVFARARALAKTWAAYKRNSGFRASPRQTALAATAFKITDP